MPLLVGIDEAGYGPLLGPMLVSSAAFDVPDKLIKADLWATLEDSISKGRAHLSGRLLINDSKQAYTKTLGIKHLQRTTLACLRLLGHKPKTIGELLQVLCPDCLPRLTAYEWYNLIDSKQLDIDETDISIAASVFARNLEKNRIELLWLKSCCLDVMHYNKLVDAARNKGAVLFNTAAVLMQHAFENRKSGTVQIVVDRQGGRASYTAGLRKMFPETDLTVIRQDSEDSSYELKSGDKTMRIHFVVGADDRFMPVSLASMVCKYVREVLNECMNEYFLKLCPELKPTAGYWKDGTRFVEDLKKSLPEFASHSHKLIRIK